MFTRQSPDVLIQLLKTETDPELRRTIVQNLGQMGSAQATAALQSLYTSDKDAAVRRSAIDALANQRNAKVLIELARKESDPAMKARIVERLAQIKSAEATDYFIEILGQP
jgi:HEAT repeat protein